MKTTENLRENSDSF